MEGTAISGLSASFTASPTNGYAPLLAHFTDTSLGDITNRAWTFGDSFTTNTTATNLTHSYTNLGYSTVMLTVSGANGVSTCTESNLVYVMAVPQPTFTTGREISLDASGQATLCITNTTGTGVQYRIIHKSDLLDSNGWTNAVTPPGWTNSINSQITLQDTNTVGVSQRFYRIEAKSKDAN